MITWPEIMWESGKKVRFLMNSFGFDKEFNRNIQIKRRKDLVWGRPAPSAAWRAGFWPWPPPRTWTMVSLSTIMYTFHMRIYCDVQHSHLQHHIKISQVLWLTCPSITSLTSSGATPVLESNSFITPEASCDIICHLMQNFYTFTNSMTSPYPVLDYGRPK